APPAPAPPAPEVPLGSATAKVNGVAWQSQICEASRSSVGGQEVASIHGLGDNLTISLYVPPRVGTYYLDQGWSGSAECAVLKPDGWWYTVQPHVGTATVTTVDSSRIAGNFHFDYVSSTYNLTLHVTAGAFNSPFLTSASSRAVP